MYSHDSFAKSITNLITTDSLSENVNHVSVQHLGEKKNKKESKVNLLLSISIFDRLLQEHGCLCRQEPHFLIISTVMFFVECFRRWSFFSTTPAFRNLILHLISSTFVYFPCFCFWINIIAVYCYRLLLLLTLQKFHQNWPKNSCYPVVSFHSGFMLEVLRLL